MEPFESGIMLSLSITFSRFFHVIACMSSLFLFFSEIGLLLMLMESQIYLCRLKSDLNQSFVVWQSHFPWPSGLFPIILCTQEWLSDRTIRTLLENIWERFNPYL